MVWTFVFLFLILKIPVVAAIWLCWWAGKDAPIEPGEDDGGTGDRPHPRAPLPSLPRRRGPHGDGPPASPARVRVGDHEAPCREPLRPL
ncbi:MAG: hypothetical protein ACJ76V_11350 [Thermoleophilaceae bacterium]